MNTGFEWTTFWVDNDFGGQRTLIGIVFVDTKR